MSPLPATPDLDEYAQAHTTPLEPLLADLADATRAELGMEQMLSGPVVGQLLRFLVALASPRTVVEIGTFSGFSALAMAPALPDGGRIITCELSEERAAFAQSWFDRSSYGARIELRRGPALETVDALDGSFDLVFIDADKEGYPDYYEAVVTRLSPGGLIAVDNTLRDGTVLDPNDERGQLMAAFNAHVQADPRTENVLLPVRDGLTLIRRTG
jgi:predicted O-methyltransferase YrrM